MGENRRRSDSRTESTEDCPLAWRSLGAGSATRTTEVPRKDRGRRGDPLGSPKEGPLARNARVKSMPRGTVRITFPLRLGLFGVCGQLRARSPGKSGCTPEPDAPALQPRKPRDRGKLLISPLSERASPPRHTVSGKQTRRWGRERGMAPEEQIPHSHPEGRRACS